MKGTRRPHFKPTNFELLNILHCRIVNNKRCSFITDMQDLYERAPWLLQHVSHVRFRENEWFYFVRRNKRPGMKQADSKRPSRTVGESGIWKTTGVVAQIKNQEGANVGTKRHISFKANSATVKDGITTGWTMHEIVLDEPWFQEVVLCRIKFCKRKDNAQYAPQFLPIVIGRERGDRIDHGVAASGEELEYVDAPVKTHEAQGMDQWTGSCSDEVASYLASQQIRALDSNYPILNGGMMQHQDFGSYGQPWGESLGQQQSDHNLGQQGTYVSHMEDHQQQCQNLFGRHGTDPSHSAQTMEEQQQQWNGYFGPYSAQPYDQRMMMEHQNFGSSALGLAQNDQNLGQNNDLSAPSEISAQQQHLGEDSNVSLTQQQNQIPGQVTHLSPMEQQFYPSQVPVMMNQALEEERYVPWSAQPNDQYNGHNNELPTVPMKTQQQHDNVIINTATQKHIEAQDNVPLINQTMEAHDTDLPMDQGINESHGGIVVSPNYSELYKVLGEEEMDSEMDNIWNDFLNEEWVQNLGKNTPEEEAELMADLTKCETFESFFDSLLSN